MDKTWKSNSMNSVSVYRNRVQWTRFLYMENEFIELGFYELKKRNFNLNSILIVLFRILLLLKMKFLLEIHILNWNKIYLFFLSDGKCEFWNNDNNNHNYRRSMECQREMIHMLAGQVVVLDPIRCLQQVGGPFLSKHPWKIFSFFP